MKSVTYQILSVTIAALAFCAPAWAQQDVEDDDTARVPATAQIERANVIRLQTLREIQFGAVGAPSSPESNCRYNFLSQGGVVNGFETDPVTNASLFNQVGPGGTTTANGCRVSSEFPQQFGQVQFTVNTGAPVTISLVYESAGVPGVTFGVPIPTFEAAVLETVPAVGFSSGPLTLSKAVTFPSISDTQPIMRVNGQLTVTSEAEVSGAPVTVGRVVVSADLS